MNDVIEICRKPIDFDIRIEELKWGLKKLFFDACKISVHKMTDFRTPLMRMFIIFALEFIPIKHAGG